MHYYDDFNKVEQFVPGDKIITIESFSCCNEYFPVGKCGRITQKHFREGQYKVVFKDGKVAFNMNAKSMTKTEKHLGGVK